MDRVRPSQLADERTMLLGLLDFLRATAAQKVSGLSEIDARRPTVAASTMTPLGVLTHLTAVERWWFSIDFGGRDVAWPWPEGSDADGFELRHGLTVGDALDRYQSEIAASNEVIDASSLDDLAAAPPDEPFTLRYAVLHMVEETARHCGHLDLLRESVDGARGE